MDPRTERAALATLVDGMDARIKGAQQALIAYLSWRSAPSALPASSADALLLSAFGPEEPRVLCAALRVCASDWESVLRYADVPMYVHGQGDGVPERVRQAQRACDGLLHLVARVGEDERLPGVDDARAQGVLDAFASAWTALREHSALAARAPRIDRGPGVGYGVARVPRGPGA